MKTQFVSALFFSLIFNQLQASNSYFASYSPFEVLKTGMNATKSNGEDPADLKIVFSQNRIWLLADEMPMKCLKTQIKNEEGKIVFEKYFTSKYSEWFLNIEALPKGKYTLYLGSDRVEKFKK